MWEQRRDEEICGRTKMETRMQKEQNGEQQNTRQNK